MRKHGVCRFFYRQDAAYWLIDNRLCRNCLSPWLPICRALLNANVPRALFCWTIPVVMLATVVATTATLSSNSYKSTSFLTQFTAVLRKQFAANDSFLREANGCNRALALRNAQQQLYPQFLAASNNFAYSNSYVNILATLTQCVLLPFQQIRF